MKRDYGKPGKRRFCAAAGAALALSVAACGDKPVETASTKIDTAAAAPQAQPAAPAPAAPAEMVDAKAAADQALAAKVKSAIVSTPALKFMAMDVRSSDGAVTLFGTADTEEQRRQAEKIAAGVPGAKSVKNELKIVRGS